MSGPGGSRAPGAASRAGRTLRRPPPPLRPGGLASPCARLGLSLRRRKESLPRALPPSLAASGPGLPVVLPPSGASWRRGPGPEPPVETRGTGSEERKEAPAASSGDRDFSRAQPLVAPRQEFPLYFTVVHPSDGSNNSLRVYRGFPALRFIEKPGAFEALRGWRHPT